MLLVGGVMPFGIPTHSSCHGDNGPVSVWIYREDRGSLGDRRRLGKPIGAIITCSLYQAGRGRTRLTPFADSKQASALGSSLRDGLNTARPGAIAAQELDIGALRITLVYLEASGRGPRSLCFRCSCFACVLGGRGTRPRFW